MKRLFMALFFLLGISIVSAQAPALQWSKSYGGTEMDWGYECQQTSDGGYILIGRTNSFGKGNFDAWLIRTNASGDTLWAKTFGDTYIDEAYGVKELNSGGFVFCGVSTAFGWAGEGWLVKTNANGNLIWSKPYHCSQGSTSNWDYLNDLCVNNDGSIVAIGMSSWNGPLGTNYNGWFLKVDANGNAVFNKNYGTDYDDRLFSISPTSDGGYIAVGDKHVAEGSDYAGWLVKFNASGDTLWTKTINSDLIDMFHDVAQTADGGYAIAGETQSYGPGGYKEWLLKTDGNGNVLWNQVFNFGGFFTILTTTDNDILTAGTIPTDLYCYDADMLKTDQDGNVIWGKTISATAWDDMIQCIEKTSDGGFIFSGRINSVMGEGEFWLAKLAPEGTNTFPLTVSIQNGWNMVSVPGINPDGQGVGNWWSGHLGTVYEYVPGSGYSGITVTQPGKGYWMKNNGAQTYNTGDEWPAGGIQTVSHDPINSSAGWNLIGGYENNIAVSGITTTPPGLISGPIYEYSSGYQVTDNLQPGYGYWIKLTAAGQINLNGGMCKTDKAGEYFNEDWGKIIIKDNAGRSYTLYAINKENDLGKYELPPVPPAGMFDIRFESGRIAENIKGGNQIIDMQGVEYPVSIEVQGMSIYLQDESSRIIKSNLNPGEKIFISDSRVNRLMILSGEVKAPEECNLEQNYPNPFNPVTTINFSLNDAANVTLSVYNVLGEKITELVKGNLESGKYSFKWDGSKEAAGLYICELRSDNFVSVKKMILMK